MEISQEMIRELVRTIDITCKQMKVPSWLWEDAHQEVWIAIMKGVDRFDPDRGIKFKTFIEHRIRGAIQDMLRGAAPKPRHFLRDLTAKGIEFSMLDISDPRTAPYLRDPLDNTGFTDRLDVERLLRMVSSRDRHILVNYLNGVPDYLTADILGVTVNYLSTCRARSIRRLRSAIKINR